MIIELAQLSAGPDLDALVRRDVIGGIAPSVHFSTDLGAASRIRARMQELGWDSEDHLSESYGTYVFRFCRWQDAEGNYLADPIVKQIEVDNFADAPLAICKASIAAIGTFK